MIEHVYVHGIIPVFETIVKRRKTFQYWRELERSQWWSEERLRELQCNRLRDMLAYCQEHSPYYKSLWERGGFHSSQVRDLSDFQDWPITSRESMRDRAADICTPMESTKFVRKSTGGSTGQPLGLRIDVAANERRSGSTFRGYAWAGASPGTRQTHLWGATLGKQSRLRVWKEHLYSRLLYRRDYVNSFDVHEQDTPALVRRINGYRPQVLVAFTNPLYQLARSVETQGLQVFSPKAIVVGAEKIYQHQRALIERVFGAPVFETYGSREFSLIGAECELHEGLHLTMENLLVEIVDDDGTPTAVGEEGNILVTDLFNRAMPFIRYAIGDRAVAGFETCRCGRGLPLLRKVSGRQLDILFTVDGRRLPGEFFPHLLKDYSAVRQFQVVQRELDMIELKLVVDRPWSIASRESLRNEIQQSIGRATRLEMVDVPGIPLTAAGKFRVVVGYRPGSRSVASI